MYLLGLLVTHYVLFNVLYWVVLLLWVGSYGSALMGRCVALVSMSIKLYLYSSNLYVYYQQLFNTYTLIFNGSTVNTLETLQHTEKKSCGSCTSGNSYKATLFVTSYKGS